MSFSAMTHIAKYCLSTLLTVKGENYLISLWAHEYQVSIMEWQLYYTIDRILCNCGIDVSCFLYSFTFDIVSTAEVM
jgi:hypothetical protein